MTQRRFGAHGDANERIFGRKKITTLIASTHFGSVKLTQPLKTLWWRGRIASNAQREHVHPANTTARHCTLRGASERTHSGRLSHSGGVGGARCVRQRYHRCARRPGAEAVMLTGAGARAHCRAASSHQAPRLSTRPHRCARN